MNLNISLQLTRKTRSVELDGKPHTLTEITGKQRDEYLNFTGSRIKMSADGKAAGIRDYTGFQSKLVSLSLTDADGKNIPEEVVNTWPASAVGALFEAAQELSGLGDKQKAAEEAVKKD